MPNPNNMPNNKRGTTNVHIPVKHYIKSYAFYIRF